MIRRSAQAFGLEVPGVERRVAFLSMTGAVESYRCFFERAREVRSSWASTLCDLVLLGAADFGKLPNLPKAETVKALQDLGLARLNITRVTEKYACECKVMLSC